ncbi:scarecrow-like protein 14 isoform X1 [Miscanthus floridulus]|uniref:scarecrow-like protein 14 isoform X1 n=2 Tax=Miscanthus floridulus TaxID=154761 RepID=UPI00345AE9C1
MATTPEVFFGKGLMEQPPPSPPVFTDDLPQEPNGSSEGQHHVPNEMMLSYISHVLLDDDIDEQLNNHPALLQVQQPFAQILSSPSSGTNTGSREGSNDFLHEGNVDESELNPALSKGTDAVGAFFKGMEEANGLLPKDNFRRDELVNQTVRESSSHSGVKKRHSRDDHLQVEIRTSKAMTVIKEPEENSANEMLDEMMLYGYKECIRDMDNLHVTCDNNEVEKKNRNSGSKETRDNNVVDIRRLMISCAQEVAVNNHSTARELLKQIMHHASETGDATQRLAQCFTKGLEARLVGTGSLLWELQMAERPSVVEFIKASNLYGEACCFNKVALAFSEMTIMQAMVGKSRLHIIDYGMQFGYQWVGLLRSLVSREGALPEVKITAIGLPKPKSYPTEKIEEIGCRLGRCAHEFGLPSFKFHTIKTNWEDACIEDLNIEADEVLVVNDLFSFSTLMDECISFDGLSPRDIVLNNISKMRPHVFIQSVYNCSYGSSFLSRFREMLFYYMALFDIFDATIPRESRSRMVLEQIVLGRSAVNALSCEGAYLVERPERYRQWQTRNQRAGLRQLPLRTSIVEVVKDMVMKHHHKDFLISQDGQWLLQGWRGRVHFAHSTWVAADAFSRV